MFDAGSAVFTLTGHVVRAPFEDYGRLVEGARKQKEHSITLTADSKPATTAFERFSTGLKDLRDNVAKFSETARASFDNVMSSSTKMATSSGADFDVMSSGAKRTAEQYGIMAASVRDSAKIVEDSNARMAESSRAAGGGGRGGVPGTTQAGQSPEEQAKKTTAAWKEGFTTLANVGKWVTAGIVGVGALSVKAASDFQRQMTLLQTQAGYTKTQVDALSKSVLNLAPAVGYGPTKLAEGLYHIASSGIPAAKAMDVLKYAAEGAKVGNANLEDTTNALVAVMKTAPSDVHGAADAIAIMTDIVGRGNLRMQDLTGALTTGILPAAKAVGLGLRDVGAAIDVMTARGIPAQEGATRLRTVLGLIADPTTKAQKALDQLGFAHNRLADDFRKHGLVYALQDLQTSMQNTFGKPLNDQQMRTILTNYATQLAQAGASTKTIEKDVAAYHKELLRTGDGAVKSSQLIADAFGGARMGTTMQILMQNIGDVRSHFNALNTDNAAGQFQNAWKTTQKDFSVQVSQMWGGIQKLGIEFGQFLIPKLQDAVKWLIQAAHWMGHHKALAEALAIALGTVLTAAVAAFFARFAAKTVEGIVDVGKFGKAILTIPSAMDEATSKVVTKLQAQKKALQEVADQAGLTGDALAGEGEAAQGATAGGREGGAGALAGAAGAIEGMINGIHGVMAPGSVENPMAVVVMAADRYGLGAQGAAAEAKTSTETVAAGKEATGGTTPLSQPVKAPTAETLAPAQILTTETRTAALTAEQEFAQIFKSETGAPVTMMAKTGVLPSGASQALKTAYAKYDAAIGAAMDEMYGLGSQATASAKSMAESYVKFDAAVAEAARSVNGGAATAGADLAGAGTKAAGTLEEGAVAASEEMVTGAKPHLMPTAAEFYGTPPAGGVTPTVIPEPVPAGPGVGTAGMTAEEMLALESTSGLGFMGNLKAGAGSALKFGSTALSGLMRGAGVFGMGALASQIGGGLIGGKTGQEVQSIGTYASIGAGIGSMIEPGIGTAVGAALAGGVAAAIKIFGQQDYGKKLADALTPGFGGKYRDNLASQISTALDNAKSIADAKAGEPYNAQFGVKGPSQAELDKMAADYKQAGTLIAQQLEVGWSQYKFQDEPTMFKQLKGEIKNMPPQVQAAAIQAAVAYATGLESKGKLVKGSSDQLVADAEKAFPGFEKYLALMGGNSAQAFAKSFNFDKVQKTTLTNMNLIASDFSVVQEAIQNTKQDVITRANDMIGPLTNIAKYGTGPMKKQAEADIKALQADVNTYFGGMVNVIGASAASMAGQVITSSSQAAKSGGSNWWSLFQQIQKAHSKGLETTQQGATLMAQALNAVIGPMGGTKIPIPKLAATIAQITPQQAATISGYSQAAAAVMYGHSPASSSSTPSSAASNPWAAYSTGTAAPPGLAFGGMLPGSEFGRGDVMTLVDPQGKPRARMAGDEAVFNRHQMPYVEAGLQALGFQGADDLWSQVSAPHSHQRGGRLRAGVQMLAGGGYLFPFPKNVRIGRTDQGVDANMGIGDPIGPIGDAKIMGIQPNWYQGQPYVWWQLLDGSRKGDYAYVAEQIIPLVSAGQTISANQAVAKYAPSGTGIEYGWAVASGATLARATSGYTEGQVTGAGSDMRVFLQGLAHGVILGGGAQGSLTPWINLNVPKVTGTGDIANLVRRGMQMITGDANAYGQKQVGSYLGGFTGGGSNTQNQALGRRMMDKLWADSQWPYLQKLWTQESGWSTTATNPSSGAYGIPQSLPAVKMAAAGADWHSNPATQIAWGLKYIHDTYGNPQGAWAHEVAHNWYAGGGWLPGFAGGRRLSHTTRQPWAPLPSATGTLPGYRPVRVRRGTSGLHTVGGGTGKGSSSLSTRGTTAKKPGSQARPKQTLSQQTANTLTALGFGSFADDQNTLGVLDTKYTNQENLFTMFSPQGMSQDQLDVLMGIREQEWDILWGEHVALPAAIAAMQANVDALSGTTTPGHWKVTSAGHKRKKDKGGVASAGMALANAGGAHSTKASAHPSNRVWVPPTTVGGVIPDLESDITDTEKEISTLEHQSQLDSQAIAGVHHTATADVMNVTDGYASQIAQLVENVNSINTQKLSNSKARVNLQTQMRNLPTSTASSTSLSVSDIVSGVMAGTLPTTGTGTTANPTKKKLQNQISALHGSDISLSQTEAGLRHQIAALRRDEQAAARKYRAQGFDAAWKLSLDKYRIADKLYTLRQTLKNLKASLAEEKKAASSDTTALQTLQDWKSGGLQGTQSIDEALEAEAFNILGLYQQGASLPTSGRQDPTLKTIEDFLTSMGLQLPPGLSQGVATATAAQAYADFQTFQASRAALFSQFGSNFLGAGLSPTSNSANVGAGTQYFGSGAGAAAGLGAPGGVVGPGEGLQGGGYINGHHHSNPGPGGTTFNITNNFAAGPPDPHTWSAGTAWEIRAAV